MTSHHYQLHLERLEELKCLLRKVGIWCSFDSESFAWNVQPVLTKVKLDEEERNAQLEECHDAKASMCLRIWGRMQSSTSSILFRFTHAPLFRGIFMPFPFWEDTENIKTTHQIKIKLQRWLSSCFQRGQCTSTAHASMFEHNWIPDTCDIHFWRSISSVHFSTGTCFYHKGGEIAKGMGARRWSRGRRLLALVNFNPIIVLSGLKFEASKLLKPSQG